MHQFEIKNLSQPDETRNLPKTKIGVVNLHEATLMRATFEPGWKWSQCVKETAGTESCKVPHINYVISGQMKIMMDDGTTKVMKAGDFAVIPSGHDAEVVGNEPCTVLDFSGGKVYGK